MNQEVFGPEHYKTKFDPEAYLNHYYSSSFPAFYDGNSVCSEAIRDGVRLSLFALPNFAKKLENEMPESERQTLIDIGAGPTVYSAICFRNTVKRVILTDYLQKNLDVIQDWLDEKNNRFEWNGVIQIVSRVEGSGLCADLQKIETESRRVIQNGGVYISDVHLDACGLEPSTSMPKIDVLVSVFCLESACSTHQQYREAMKHMLQLLRPGGRVIIGSVIDDDRYNSGKLRMFTLLSVTEEEIICELRKNNIDTTENKLHKIILDDQGVMFLMGVKKLDY
uniref:Methyltransf_11 domain-containing protein n=1 Tax=Syphacia muris TaxID=451379 RepID=A0A0N5AVT5_9BILA